MDSHSIAPLTRAWTWVQTNRGAYLTVGVITLGALLIRLWHLDTEPLHVDEIRQVTEVQDTWIRVIRASYGSQQPPLDYLIGKAVVTILPATDFVQRLPAALFGTGSVGLVGVVLIRAGHAIPSLFASFFIAISPLQVELSQYARPYALPVFLVVATIAAYRRWHSGRRGGRSVALFAVLAALALLSRASMPMVALAILGAVGLIVAVRGRTLARPVEIIRADPLALVVLPALFVAVWIPNAVRITTATDPLGSCLTCDKWAKAAQAVENFGTFGERAVRPTSLVWLLAAVGVVLFWRAARAALADTVSIWAPLLLTAPAFAVLHAVALPPGELFAHRFMAFLPVGLAVYLAIAVTAILRARASQGARRHAVSVVVGLVLLVTAIDMASAVKTQAQTLDLADWRGTAEYVESIERPGDVIVSIDTRPFSSESKFGFRAAPRYYDGALDYWSPEKVADQPGRVNSAQRVHFVLFVPKVADDWAFPSDWTIQELSEMMIVTTPELPDVDARNEAWWTLSNTLRSDVSVATLIAGGVVQESMGLEAFPFFETARSRAEAIGQSTLFDRVLAGLP